MNYSDNYIEHHGVLGMKWGVRKDRIKSYRTARKAKKNADREERRTIRANRVAGKYVNSELNRGTGAVGGKAVAQGAKAGIRDTKKALNFTTGVRYAGSSVSALGGLGMLLSGSAAAAPVGALMVVSASTAAIASHFVNKEQQDILDRAISTIDAGDIATRVDTGLRDRDD